MLEKERVAPLEVFGNKYGQKHFLVSYRTKVYVSTLLGDNIHRRYLELIGVMNWDFEIGRIDSFN